jgi:hypothetical protein
VSKVVVNMFCIDQGDQYIHIQQVAGHDSSSRSRSR